MAYRRSVLSELGGFISSVIGQEDVEFVIRFTAAGKKVRKSRMLSYAHPPLITNDFRKAAAVGASFAKLKKRYPFIIWLVLLMNGLRFLPLLLLLCGHRNVLVAQDDPLEFVRILESAERVRKLQVERVVESLSAGPGDKIADLGAGSGLFTRLLAERVGPEGEVYAPIFKVVGDYPH